VFNNCKIKVSFFLDVKTVINDKSGTFTIVVPEWNPTNLQVLEVGEDRIKLTWDNYTGFVYDSIQIFRKPDLNGNNQFGRIAKVSGNTNTFTDHTVEFSKTYTYKVRAFEDGIVSVFSNTVSATTNKLNPPTNLQVFVLNKRGVELFWKDNSNNEEGYEIWRKGVNGGWKKVGEVEESAVYFLDTTVTEFFDYFYKVRARYGNTYSMFSDSVWVTLSPLIASNANASKTGKGIIWMDGKYHMVYEKENSEIYYAFSYNGYDWVSEFVDNGKNPCIVFNQNNVYIFYFKEGILPSTPLKFGIRDNNGWDIYGPYYTYRGNYVSAISYKDTIFLIVGIIGKGSDGNFDFLKIRGNEIKEIDDIGLVYNIGFGFDSYKSGLWDTKGITGIKSLSDMLFFFFYPVDEWREELGYYSSISLDTLYCLGIWCGENSFAFIDDSLYFKWYSYNVIVDTFYFYYRMERTFLFSKKLSDTSFFSVSLVKNHVCYAVGGGIYLKGRVHSLRRVGIGEREFRRINSIYKRGLNNNFIVMVYNYGDGIYFKKIGVGGPIGEPFVRGDGIQSVRIEKRIEFDIRFPSLFEKNRILLFIPKKGRVKLGIFDITGRKRFYLEKIFKKGIHTVNIPEFKSGIYFIKAEFQDKKKIKKILKIK